MKNNSIYRHNIFSFENTTPKVGENVFIAPGAKLVGDIELGDYVSVWFNCVIRGDVNYVKIGDYTNVQDLSMLHVTNGKFPLEIGSRVTIGHSVKLHGCIIEDDSLIGIGSVVLDGARIEKNVIIGAGSVVPPGKIIPSGKLAVGAPAKVIRDLTNEEIAYFDVSARNYAEYSEKMHRELYG